MSVGRAEFKVGRGDQGLQETQVESIYFTETFTLKS
jgi:hypothetical protein